VEAKARPVRIDGIELLEVGDETLRVVIHCGRGTYARVIAEEIGVALGTVGHLEELRRLTSGPFAIERALSFARLADIVAGDPAWHTVLRPGREGERVAWKPREAVVAGLADWTLPSRQVLKHLPALTLSPLDARRFLQTGRVPAGVSGERPTLLLEGDAILGVAVPGQASATPLGQPTAREQRRAPQRHNRPPRRPREGEAPPEQTS